MNTIPPTSKSVKTKQDYIALALWQNDRQLFDGEQNSLKRASIYAQLALSAPEPAAPPDYLSVCAERDKATALLVGLVSELEGSSHLEELISWLRPEFRDLYNHALSYVRNLAQQEESIQFAETQLRRDYDAVKAQRDRLLRAGDAALGYFETDAEGIHPTEIVNRLRIAISSAMTNSTPAEDNPC